VKLKGRDLLSWVDYSRDEFMFLLNLSKNLKERFYAGERYVPTHLGKTVLGIFEKPSTRTRISLEVAANQLGMKVIYSNPQELQLGRGETIEDTARVVTRLVDGVMARVYSHASLIKLAENADVPIINALSDECHPTQVLADALTIWEKLGRLSGVKLAFVGDGDNNMSHSLMQMGAKLGMEVRIVSPKGYWPSKKYLEPSEDDAKKSGGSIIITDNLEEGVKGVDVVYTDVWVSMGFEKEAEERLKVWSPYQVNSRVMELAGKDSIFMHCLPAHRGYEVTDDVVDSRQSVVWDEAENRMHTIKAILSALI